MILEDYGLVWHNFYLWILDDSVKVMPNGRSIQHIINKQILKMNYTIRRSRICSTFHRIFQETDCAEAQAMPNRAYTCELCIW